MSDIRISNFQSIPPVIKNLVIINALVFLAQKVFDNSNSFNMENLFALHDIRSVYFKPHQLVTHLFMHGNLTHILFNMLALWMFGSILENLWGSKRFLIFYMACGLGAAALHLGVLYVELAGAFQQLHSFPPELMNTEQYYRLFLEANQATLGASGAIFGCLAAFGYLFPNSMIYVYFFIPIKAKWFVIIYAAMELWLGVNNSAGDNVAHWAHLGGALVGFLLVFYWNKTNRRNFY